MYEGEYQNDLKHGWGVYKWADGKHFEGEWMNGKQHGKGKIVMPDGKVLHGLLNEGKRIKWIKEGGSNGGS